MGESSVQFSDHYLHAPAATPAPRAWSRLRELSAAWVDALGMVRVAAGRRRAALMSFDGDAHVPAVRGLSPRQWRRHSALLTYRQQAGVVKGASRGGAIWAGGPSGAGRDD